MKAKLKDNISKRYLILVVALSIILGAGIVVADDEVSEISISITPATLNLDETVNEFVIVHTEIPYDQVNTTTLELKEVNNVSVDAIYTEPDRLGNLVVKFDCAEVAEIVDVGEEVTLTLTGMKLDETPFTGSDTIRVIDK